MKSACEGAVGFDFLDVGVGRLKSVDIIVGFKAHGVFGDVERTFAESCESSVVVVKDAKHRASAASQRFLHIALGFDVIGKAVKIYITEQLIRPRVVSIELDGFLQRGERALFVRFIIELVICFINQTVVDFSSRRRGRFYNNRNFNDVWLDVAGSDEIEQRDASARFFSSARTCEFV